MTSTDQDEQDQILGLPNVIVVVVEPENPGNIGFSARVLANFGVDKLRIVGNNPTNDQFARIFAVNAQENLDNAEIFQDLGTALSDVENAWAATARSGSNHSVTRAVVPLEELPDPMSRNGNVALVFGRESNGLTNDEVTMCDLAFKIPTSDNYPSMNLSHAIAVTLYELHKNYGITPERTSTDIRPATPHEKEVVAKFYDELIDLTTIKDFRKPIAKQVMRNLIQRAFITGREIHTLAGTVRKIRALIDNPEE